MSEELIFEEEVSYGCTPPEVLAALGRINSRVAQHKLDDPGEYEQTDIAAQWMSENLRSNWKLSVTVKRVMPETDPAPKSAQGVETPKIEVKHAVEIQGPAQLHAGDFPLTGVRKESRSAAVGRS